MQIIFVGAPITREDMVTVLWRYDGSPAGSPADFDDESSIFLIEMRFSN